MINNKKQSPKVEVLREYEKERERQNYSCLLCGAHETTSTHSRLHIDHCHDTGLFRGLLCMRCNTGLGAFNDNVEVLSKAIEYVNENRIRHRNRLQPEQDMASSDEEH